MKSNRNLFVSGIFFLALFFLYLPLVYLIFQAFLQNPNDWSSGFTTQWLTRVFQSGALWEPLMASFKIAVFAATISVIVGTLGAVGLNPMLARLPLSVQTLISLPILLPEVITGLSLLLFFLLCRFQLGIMTVILAHASFSASFVYFIMIEQLKKLDPQLEEAGLDLGAEPKEVFWKVTLPNILPGIMGGWLLAFTLSFDDFLISFFTSGAGVTTLPLKIYSLMRRGVSPELNGFSFMLICLSTLLVVAVMLKEQNRKWIVKG